MGNISENKNCYATRAQREVLIQLVSHPTIEEQFFLTGGTALSVFYLHHRLSNDLDLFSIKPMDLGEIDFWVKRQWPNDCAKIKEGPQFLSFLIKDVKVDFIIDPVSMNDKRAKFRYENGHSMSLDTITNIVSNKLCAAASRTEPKDFIDLYMIFRTYSDVKFKYVYQQSRLKDAIFDDPPTAAFQIENGVSFLKENSSLMPKTFTKIDFNDFLNFYGEMTKWLYGLVKP